MVSIDSYFDLQDGSYLNVMNVDKDGFSTVIGK